MRLALIKYSLQGLGKRKMRSFLTIISVLISITAITALISFGQGMSSYVSDFSQQMGDDKVIIHPRGLGFGTTLDTNVNFDNSDLDAVRDINGVDEATGLYFMPAKIKHKKEIKYVYMIGSDFNDYEDLVNEVYGLDILQGKKLTGKKINKAVLGYSYLFEDKIFSNSLTVKDKININDIDFDISGFYEEVGNPVDDSNIYITTEAMEDLFNASSYHMVLVRAAPNKDPRNLVEDIKKDLRKQRGQNEENEDFFVETFEQAIETFNSVLKIITAVVILIALISIIVASVNIMNTMYTSILERTKEIGVFKAIGSGNKDIMFIFILESGVLSLIGGVIGVGLGYLISKVAGKAVEAAGYAVFKPIFTWQLVVYTLIFAFLIGIGAGLLPAYRASKLKPVDSLRYE